MSASDGPFMVAVGNFLIQDRKLGRAGWSAYYRQMRIIRRECSKAFMDAIIYGVGFVKFDADAEVEYISAQEVFAATATG